MKFALATVIYPSVKQFFPEFIQSLRNQTDQGFHLLIVNDGCNLSDFDLSDFEYTLLDEGGSISKNREILINEAYSQQYEWIVFADADDWFEANRIEIIRSLISNYDVIANEIVPFTNEHFSGPKFEHVLGNFQQIDLNFIFDKNLFGLSNAACRTQFLKDITIPNEIIAVDWFLFTKAIQSGAKACFTAKTKTFYRQWEENIIGIDKISEKEIKIGVKAKYFHYKRLIGTNPWYKDNLPWITDLYQKIENSEFDSYIKKVREAEQKATFWWENIKNYNNG
jgi:glycosyltransferase involved in cell wall biosynthesis